MRISRDIGRTSSKSGCTADDTPRPGRAGPVGRLPVEGTPELRAEHGDLGDRRAGVDLAAGLDLEVEVGRLTRVARLAPDRHQRDELAASLEGGHRRAPSSEK